METGNIIAVYNDDKRIALNEFDALMRKTNDYMNKIATLSDRFRGCDAKQLEKETLAAIREQCTNTSFNPSDIELVSGQRFPDIVAGQHFGVEVKSTKENKWVSTGSSIVESTRVDDVGSIYMLFGKLGGIPAEFRCKPYQNCLYDIAVTHSPRYLIDMNVSPENTIFSKMGVDYDEFRLSENQIDTVRNYYKNKMKEREQKAMPWWMGGDIVTSPTLRLWGDRYFTTEEQNRYKAEMLLLFPEEICGSQYDNAALWLCVRHSVINTHFRDLFSAGGQVRFEGQACKAVVGRVKDLAPLVKKLLVGGELEIDMMEYNPSLYHAKDRYVHWVNQVANQLMEVKSLKKYLLNI